MRSFELSRRFCFVILISWLIVDRVSAQVTQSDLRAYCEWAARSGTVKLGAPEFDWGDEYLRYVFVTTVPSDIFGRAEDPIMVPMDQQFIVTAIRRYRNNRQQHRFWEPVLAKVEGEIEVMTSLINSNDLKGKALLDALDTRSSRIADIYHEELTNLARSKGLKGATTEWRTAYHCVEVAADPNGAVISYISAGRWSLFIFMTQQRNKKDYPQPEWITIRQADCIGLTGKNWFFIKWADGTSQREQIKITSQSRIKFTKTSSPNQ